MPIVGTVPAIKPAAAATQSGLISCSRRRHGEPRLHRRTHPRFCQRVDVTLVGSKALAGLAERALRGEEVADEAIRAEIAPCLWNAKGAARSYRAGLHALSAAVARLKALAPCPSRGSTRLPPSRGAWCRCSPARHRGGGSFRAHSRNPAWMPLAGRGDTDCHAAGLTFSGLRRDSPSSLARACSAGATHP